MKNIFKSSLLLVLGLGLFVSCEDDNSNNPTLQTPTTFVLNTPAAANQPIDLANSSTIDLTCSQPDYGFTASTQYKVMVSLNSDMSNAQELSESYTKAKIELDAATLASTLTTMEVEQYGRSEADFPMDIPVYFRVRANVIDANNNVIEGTEILSNIVSLNKVHLLYSLSPVTAPEKIYITGNFCSWSWDTCVEMIPVYGTDNVYWRMVYIDDSGIKFNSAKAWDGGEVGYDGITVSGDLASEIVSGGGNIASSNPGWYLMIVTATISGRNILYDVQFNKPQVWLMGPCIGDSSWSELLDGALFSVPTTSDGEFVSPAFTGSVPGGDGDGVRAYVKVPGYDWWKSEFIVFDGKIAYRGTDGDQDRVAGNIGQQLYLNFATDEGEIK